MENKNYLINIILVILISGIILSTIGNYILNKFSQIDKKILKSCDKKLIEEHNKRENNKMGNNGINGYTLSFTGYVVIAMGLLFLIIFSTFFSIDNKKDDIQNVKNIITGNLPVFLSLIVVSYILLLNNQFKEKLIKGRIANDYFSYLLFFSLIFSVQIIILCKYIKSFDKNNNQLGSVIYALGLVSLLILGIMNIILSFFNTDG